VPDTFISFL